jgi:glutamine amidotransferase
MQLFFEESEEDTTRCLGLLPGKVRKFDDQAVKVPHIGWNQIHFSQDSGHSSTLLRGIPSGSFFYFVHSYYAPVEGFSVAKTDYSVHFSSALHFRNLWGVQFHPELSGALGLHMLKNFLSECRQE